MFTILRNPFPNSWFWGLALMLFLSTNLSALEYEFSDDGLNGVEWEGGRTEFEFADINNDGHIDFLSIGDHGSPRINTNQHGVMVFFGDGTGSWNVAMSGEFGYGGIAVGDVNNDGDWDVGYADHHPGGDEFGNQMIEVALGDGSGENWEPWDDGLAVPRGNDDWYGMFGTDFGDFNNDGLLDIGSNSFGSGTGLHLYANNGDGSWEDALYHFGRNNSSMDFVFGDIDNDGNLDFACALEEKEVHWGNGEGDFEYELFNLPDPGEFDYYYSVDLGDVDGDGADDIALVHGEPDLFVFTFDPEE
ncbi:MAG: VCBS repeat-containing protein, partial [Candidatus Electryoneaceae bacterium]|nr:VCBS repeat-containing protein [Candidatus Electryoneaceae bacterium]